MSSRRKKEARKIMEKIKQRDEELPPECHICGVPIDDDENDICYECFATEDLTP